jgi:PUA-domain protein
LSGPGAVRFLKISSAPCFDMTVKTILKDRDAKPLVEELNRIPGLGQLSHKSRVETEQVKGSEIIFVDGQPVAFKRDTLLVPVLTNSSAVEKLPRVTVDMGAVPHVVGGADIMAPGVRKVEGSFAAKQLVVVIDEKHGKSLAIGAALYDSVALAATKKGKVITNLHYVSDVIWETIKPATL